MQSKQEQLVSTDNGSPTPAALIQRAVEQGASADHLEKLLELQLRWEANEARKAYVRAMTKFKAAPPEIPKDRRVSYKTKRGTTIEYDHATLGAIAKLLTTELSKHGLTVSWSTDQAGRDIVVTCTITHAEGHSESTTLRAAADEGEGRNTLQAICSTVTYLQRYTLLAIAGLAAIDQDDDGLSATGPAQGLGTCDKEPARKTSRKKKAPSTDGLPATDAQMGRIRGLRDEADDLEMLDIASTCQTAIDAHAVGRLKIDMARKLIDRASAAIAAIMEPADDKGKCAHERWKDGACEACGVVCEHAGSLDSSGTCTKCGERIPGAEG